MSKRICSIEGCEFGFLARGWCSKHYNRWHQTGSTDLPIRERPPVLLCSIDGCERSTGAPGSARGLCRKHYRQWRTHGDPLFVKPKRVPKRVPKACSVDGCDGPIFHCGWCSMHYARWKRHGDPLWRKRGEIRQGCKICSRCGLDLPLDTFGTSVAKLSGLNTYCRECVCVVAKESRSRRPGYWVLGGDRRRARKAGVLFERFYKAAIFDRDSWRCGICGEHIHRVFVFPHPMSPSLDHIVPLVAGGAHVTSNAQASHWRCNRAKWASVSLHQPADGKGACTT